MAATLLLLLALVKYLRVHARVCVKHAHIPPRANVYDLCMLLLPPLLIRQLLHLLLLRLLRLVLMLLETPLLQQPPPIQLQPCSHMMQLQPLSQMPLRPLAHSCIFFTVHFPAQSSPPPPYPLREDHTAARRATQ